MLFSIITPAFNRPDTLLRTYQSLQVQTYKDFEWLIIDDSTTDEVENEVKAWLLETQFKLRYQRQVNSGKHIAHNHGVKLAEGELTILLDDDDTLVPEALERYAFHWQSMLESERKTFCGIAALCVNRETGKVLGGEFPEDIFDSDTIEISYVYDYGDDRQSALRTDVLGQFLFPSFGEEKYVTESLVWNRVAQHYKTRFINEVLCVKEYRMTKSIHKHLARSPNATATYYHELLDLAYPFSTVRRLKFNVNYVRYSLHAHHAIRQILKTGSRNPLYRFPGFALGSLMFLYDKAKFI